ncbi:MAG: DUF134 domain-containing protein [Clostridiales bacterium]|jgi:predicted DNA-binding protein (UPF0251 family)|nr:DUF134 domain-containing protein [Clostridiales bacterium]OPZ69657.1 MAG: hypothetical protein BWY81_00332 [Firmicutes bacterium ADurb.Bin467]
MPRPRKCRRVCGHPRCDRFEPAYGNGAEPVVLQVDEFEAVRLIDYEGLLQEDCAERMGIARTTVTGIYMRARRKIADALVNGRTLIIRGGDFELCTRGDGACGCGRCRRGGDCHAPGRDGAVPGHRPGEH